MVAHLQRAGEEEDAFVAGAQDGELVGDEAKDGPECDDRSEGDTENLVGDGEFHAGGKMKNGKKPRSGPGWAISRCYRPY